MRAERVAVRYSRALFMCVDEDGALVKIEGELALLSSLMSAENSDFRTALLNPAFRKEEQINIINEMAASFDFHALTKNLLLLLVETGRAALLPAIAKAFLGEVDGRLSRVRARITSAKPLEKLELEEVLSALRLRAGKNVVAEVELDERVGMGVKAQIGGVVYDATLSSMLESFKRKLIDAPIH